MCVFNALIPDICSRGLLICVMNHRTRCRGYKNSTHILLLGSNSGGMKTFTPKHLIRMCSDLPHQACPPRKDTQIEAQSPVVIRVLEMICIFPFLPENKTKQNQKLSCIEENRNRKSRSQTEQYRWDRGASEQGNRSYRD